MGSLLLGNTAWVLPPVVKGAARWVIYVRVADDKGRIHPIRPAWLDDAAAFPPDKVALYDTLTWHGDGAPRASTPTVVAAGRQGRSALQQAVAEARAKWERRRGTAAVAAAPRACGTVPPMLLKVMDVEMTPAKFEAADVEWYAQRKYDGIRCVACAAGGGVKLFSRTLKSYDVPHVAAALGPFLARHPRAMLDGELYIHGVPLQTLSGAVRRSKTEPADPALNARLALMVFDVYLFDRPDAAYVERRRWLDEHLAAVGQTVKPAPTYPLGSSNPAGPFLRRLDDLYRTFLDEGYEGMVVRRADAAYVPSYHGRHTDAAMKHKPLFTDDFKVVGYSAGRGKEHDKVIWTCVTKTKKEFKVRPKRPDDERRAVYEALRRDPGLFDRKYKNKPLTVEYAALSVDGVPQQPRGVAFRTYE